MRNWEYKMKRNCNNCKALISNINGIGCRCSLGHEIEFIKTYYNIPVAYKPLEKCEKPITFKKLCQMSIKL